MMPEQKQQHPLSLRPADDAVTCDETVAYVIYCHGDLYTIHALHVNDSDPDDPSPQSVLTLQPHDLPQLMGFGCLGSSICMIGGE
ncbi:hypothetical protein CDL15_Pgr002952 [Punica granatum]|uniref:Uncharacterized protein n=1 Tax=Punica granatum TaxID=22663 RepID=A0A218X2T0_PUNGR|nr:hypothetical protein CDL15_Pgr002952 [Punica granatum]